MNLYAIIFYILAAVILVSTALAVTRRNLMHAIVYLVLSFFGTALLFYLLGAPFLAGLEVIIYAGAIMVLFLFIVMMLEVRASEEPIGAYLLRWLPAAVLGGLCLAAACLVLGLFTRVAAGIIWIQMVVIVTMFQWKFGYFWTSHGIEYALLLWLLCTAIIFRGGERYSIDRLLGKEF